MGVCSGKATRVGSNALNLYVQKRQIELVGCRLYRALLASNTKLIHLRARCSLGNRAQLRQIMTSRRHVHVLDEGWRGNSFCLDSLREVTCQHVTDKTGCVPRFIREPSVLENILR